MIQLIKKISPHPITGLNRGIKLKSIQYVDFELEEAKIIWEEVLLDENDAVIENSIVPTRDIVSVLSNRNKVTNEGITITLDYFKSITPRVTNTVDITTTDIDGVETVTPTEVEETESEYNTRVNEIFNTAFDNGNPEFDFYVQNILNLPAIEGAIALLDYLKRFDRK